MGQYRGRADEVRPLLFEGRVEMFVIDITGNIGAGKTEAREFFRAKGATVLDLDRIGKEALLPGTPAHDLVVDAFGRDIVGPDGTVQARRLAVRAFASDEATAKLESILHPYIIAEVMRTLAELAADRSAPPVVVIEVPVLARAPELRDMADLVLAVTAPERVRVERAMRRGMSEEDARARVARQVPEDQVRAIADVAIDNDGDVEAFLGKLERFWKREVAPRVR